MTEHIPNPESDPWLQELKLHHANISRDIVDRYYNCTDVDLLVSSCYDTWASNYNTASGLARHAHFQGLLDQLLSSGR
jgi:hypothetical protein